MADLTGNTTYGNSGTQSPTASFSNLANLTKNLQTKTTDASAKTFGSALTDYYNPNLDKGMTFTTPAYQYQKPYVPGTPYGEQQSVPLDPTLTGDALWDSTDAYGNPKTKARTEPMPIDYNQWDMTDAYGKPITTTPVDPIIRNWPMSLGGGQYVSDKTQPGKIIKSERLIMDPKINPGARKAILGDLPSSFYEVDHVIPLWAGGADTLANLEALNLVEHNKKTAIQSIALTLLRNNKITENEAKIMAFSWKDKDQKHVPSIDEVNSTVTDKDGVITKYPGQVSLKTAEKFAEKWKKDMTPSMWKFFGESFKENMMALGNKIPVLGEFGKGLVGGFTAGIIPGTSPTEESGALGEYSNLAGNILGMGVGLGKFKLGLKATTAIPGAIKAARTGGSFLDALKLSKAGSAVVKDLTTLTPGILGKAFPAWAARGTLGLGAKTALTATPEIAKVATLTEEALAPLGAFETGKLAKASSQAFWERAKMAAAEAGWFGAWGQTGQTIRQITGQEDATLQDHIKRAGYDMFYGGLMGGSGYGIKGYGAIGAGTLTASLMEGMDSKEALKNTALMMGLHAFGSINGRPMNRAVELGKAETNKMARTALSEHTDLIPQFRTGENPNAEIGKSIDPVQMEKMRQQYMKTRPDDRLFFEEFGKIKTQGDAIQFIAQVGQRNLLIKAKLAGDWSPEEVQAESNRITTAAREIYKQTLPEEQRIIEDWKDLKSTADLLKPGIGETNLRKVLSAKDIAGGIKVDSLLNTLNTVEVPPNFKSATAKMTGEQVARGHTSLVGAEERANLERFIASKQTEARGEIPETTFSDTVVIVNDSVTGQILRSIRNLGIGGEKKLLMTGSKEMTGTPENATRIFLIEKTPTGYELKPVGFGARTESYDPANKFNVNQEFHAMEKRIQDIFKMAESPEDIQLNLANDRWNVKVGEADAQKLFDMREKFAQMDGEQLIKALKPASPLVKYSALFSTDAVSAAMKKDGLPWVTARVANAESGVQHAESGEPSFTYKITPKDVYASKQEQLMSNTVKAETEKLKLAAAAKAFKGEKLPVIDWGPEARSKLPTIQIGEPKTSTGSYKYVPLGGKEPIAKLPTIQMGTDPRDVAKVNYEPVTPADQLPVIPFGKGQPEAKADYTEPYAGYSKELPLKTIKWDDIRRKTTTPAETYVNKQLESINIDDSSPTVFSDIVTTETPTRKPLVSEVKGKEPVKKIEQTLSSVDESGFTSFITGKTKYDLPLNLKNHEFNLYNYGEAGEKINEGFAKVVDTYIADNKLEEWSPERVKLEAFRDSITSSELKDMSEKAFAKTGDINEGGDAFINKISEQFTTRDIPDPTADPDIAQTLRAMFRKNIYSKPMNIYSVDENLTFNQEVSTSPHPKSSFEKRIEKVTGITDFRYLESGIKEIERESVSYPERPFSPSNSKLNSSIVIEKYLKDGYIPFFYDNSIESSFGIKYDPKLAEGRPITDPKGRDAFKESIFTALGYKKGISTINAIEKRIKSLNLHEQPSPIEGEIHKVFVIKDSSGLNKSVAETTPNWKEINMNPIVQNGTKVKEDLGALGYWNGDTFCSPNMLARRGAGAGFVEKPYWIKDTITYYGTNVKTRETELVHFKHETRAWTPELKARFEKELGRELTDTDYVSIETNVKEGLKTSQAVDKGKYWEFEIPSEAWSQKFQNPHSIKATLSVGSLTSKIDVPNEIKELMVAPYKEHAIMIKNVADEFNNFDGMNTIKKIWEKYPELKKEAHVMGLYGDIGKSARAGAGPIELGKELDKVINNLIEDQYFTGKFFKGDTLHVVTDFGEKIINSKTGERGYLNAGEVGIPRESFISTHGEKAYQELLQGKDFYVLTYRFPILTPNAIRRSKVIINEDNGIEMGRTQVIVNSADKFGVHNADTDGDTLQYMKIGDKGGIPKEIADHFKAEEAKGETYFKQLTDTPKVPYDGIDTFNKTMKYDENTFIGGKSVGIAAAASRPMREIISNQGKIVISPAIDVNGVMKRKWTTYLNGKPFEEGYSNEFNNSGQNNFIHNPKGEFELIPRYGEKEAYDLGFMGQAAVDINGKNDLPKILEPYGSDPSSYVNDLLWKNSTRTLTENEINPVKPEIRKYVSPGIKNILFKAMKTFQVPYKLDKVTYIEGTKKPETVIQKLKPYIERQKIIKEMGGKTSLAGEMALQLEEVKSIENYLSNSEMQLKIDKAAVKNVKELFPEEVAKLTIEQASPELIEWRTVFEKTKENLERRPEKISTSVLKAGLAEAWNKFKKEKRLTPKQRQEFALWAATSDFANIAYGKYRMRLTQMIYDTPGQEVAKAFFSGQGKWRPSTVVPENVQDLSKIVNEIEGKKNPAPKVSEAISDMSKLFEGEKEDL